MISCTRRLEFDAGHRVVEHESKCRHLHGHRYVVEVTATPEPGHVFTPDNDACTHCSVCNKTLGANQADSLDRLGRVLDFAVLKERIGGWLDAEWDHGLVLWCDDPLLDALTNLQVGNYITQKVALMPANPTAENMAAHLLRTVIPPLLAGTGVVVTKVVVHETPNCRAEATRA